MQREVLGVVNILSLQDMAGHPIPSDTHQVPHLEFATLDAEWCLRSKERMVHQRCCQ